MESRESRLREIEKFERQRKSDERRILYFGKGDDGGDWRVVDTEWIGKT